MTKPQASAINAKFLQMKSEIHLQKQEYSYLKAVADSMTALNEKNKVVLYQAKEKAAKTERIRKEQIFAEGVFFTWVFIIHIFING
jgi:hypothetical protein